VVVTGNRVSPVCSNKLKQLVVFSVRSNEFWSVNMVQQENVLRHKASALFLKSSLTA